MDDQDRVLMVVVVVVREDCSSTTTTTTTRPVSPPPPPPLPRVVYVKARSRRGRRGGRMLCPS